VSEVSVVSVVSVGALGALGGAVVRGRVSEKGSNGSEKLIFDESWEGIVRYSCMNSSVSCL
jgi:hypothetical protein